jgi:DMSO/TMAO reductase YedYZ molybdopterin-dependent catalytic subunit
VSDRTTALRPSIHTGAVAGFWLGFPYITFSLLAERLTGLRPLPTSIFDLLARQLPGGLVTAVIELMVRIVQGFQLGRTDVLAKWLELGLAYVLAFGMLAVLGALYGALAGRLDRSLLRRGVTLGLALWALAWLVDLAARWDVTWSPIRLLASLLLGTAWGIALAWLHEQANVRAERLASEAPEGSSRRAFLARAGGAALALAVAGLALDRLIAGRERLERTGELLPSPSLAPRPERPPNLVPSPSAVAAEAFQPVPGTRPEVTPLGQFYRIDINLSPPRIDAAEWRLTVDGLVARPLSLTYQELLAMPAHELCATLECISNEVGGDLISTTRFSGVRLAEVLNRAGLDSAAVEIRFTCADGYTESLPLDSALDPDTLLCVAMDGQRLPAEHGFPVRLFTPNRYGMKNPKWIVRIDALGEPYDGFWVQRGWSKDAWVKTTSVIDVARGEGSSRLLVGGIAYAGARGIALVEVRVGEGAWVPAQLKEPLSPSTWVLWRVEIEVPPGEHVVAVRAVDGQGTLQAEEVTGSFPDGASGYHRRRVEIG